MGVQILDKDVSVISSIANVAKAQISNVGGIVGWAGGGPASQGPQAGSTAVNDTSIGTRSWSVPTNIFSTTATSAGVYYGEITNYIKATNFGFSIPSGATINGIVATITRLDGSDQGTYDYRVRIVKNNVIGSTDRSNPNVWTWTGTGESITYGSSSDLWGETWTASDINSSNFGIAFSATKTLFGKNENLPNLRNLKITVHYTT